MYYFKKTLLGYVLLVSDFEIDSLQRNVVKIFRKANQAQCEEFLEYYQHLKDKELQYDLLVRENFYDNESNHSVNAMFFKKYKFIQHKVFRKYWVLHVFIRNPVTSDFWFEVKDFEFQKFNNYLDVLKFKSEQLKMIKLDKPELFI